MIFRSTEFEAQHAVDYIVTFTVTLCSFASHGLAGLVENQMAAKAAI